nr:MAG TPA: hypothetical protein [Caudoviricetes sp.]
MLQEFLNMFLKKRWIKFLMFNHLGDVKNITEAISQLCNI